MGHWRAIRQDNLGLFDTPAEKRDVRAALAYLGLLLVASLGIFIFSRTRLTPLPAVVPVVDATICLGELVIASLLFSQAVIFRSRALAVLASSFVFTALLLVPHALTFPGAFGPTGLLSPGLSGTAWIMMFRKDGFPLAILLYAGLKHLDAAPLRDGQQRRPTLLLSLGAAVALAIGATMLAIFGQHLLPPIFHDTNRPILTSLLVFNVSHLLLLVAAMGALWRKRLSMLDLWLIVALFGWLVQVVLNAPSHERFTLGWYSLYLVTLISHLVVLLALIIESNRLYARLALSLGALHRERDTRLMSMDAVAAAISHEVGQPLAAVSLHASAGLYSLDREPADTAAARESLHAALEASNRTFGVLRSVRATFGQEKDYLSAFSLNDVASETTSLLSRDLAAHRISLSLALDDGLPPIVANGVQVQRVLNNIVTNAIEELSASQRGPRHIEIRSGRADRRTVWVEVSDSGQGIPLDRMEKVFEPFFTTKPRGTGLGLSLSRTIVEEHGGRLWASAREGGGTIVHLHMPCDEAA